MRKLEELIQHPKLSERGKSKLGCALRIQKVVVILGIRALAVPGGSDDKQTAARPRPSRSNPGPDELLEEFDRGFAFDNHVREELNYDQMNGCLAHTFQISPWR